MKLRKERSYSFFVISEGAEKKIKWTVSESALLTFVFFFFVFIFIGASMTVDYMSLLLDQNENQSLRKEVQFLKQELASSEGKLTTLTDSLERMTHFYSKLKLISNVREDESEDRSFSLSRQDVAQKSELHQLSTQEPTREHSHSHTEAPRLLSRPLLDISQGEVFRSYEKYNSISIRLSRSIKRAHIQERNIVALYDELLGRQAVLNSTPNIAPVNTWISSRFGYRRDPFTSEIAMHHGLDFSGPIGTLIRATADGVVRYIGYDSDGYGKYLILDHGFGLSTYYAHNSKISVKLGQRVSRRDVIAFMGNTGRSTGPHLHYEVRLNGVPVNPENYILGY